MGYQEVQLLKKILLPFSNATQLRKKANELYHVFNYSLCRHNCLNGLYRILSQRETKTSISELHDKL